eukprot:TRINITY_DN1288_c0_g1_i1.p1 TRINITY_DN1288_c0_g1~~TRINITY_DN1288_c0_g1_i1.p1  ORF type:complete len:282 (+),score=117.32 TRINITY_DN1288_c0_g1_i1:162-1007(+)
MADNASGGCGILIGGAAAQACEVLAFGHLLDRVKIEQQVKMQPARQVMRSMYQKGGLQELYKGMGCNLSQALLKGGSRWAVVGGADAVVGSFMSKETRVAHPVLANGAVGVVAGFAETTFISCPLESLKIAQMTGGARSALQTEGVKMLWNGWTAQVAKQVITWCTFLMAYEHVKQTAYKIRGTEELGTADKIGVGVGTGAISTIVQAPADLAKTLSQTAKKGGKSARRGLASTLSHVVRTQGFGALFAGVSTKLVRHCSTATIMLCTMDYLGCMPESMKL